MKKRFVISNTPIKFPIQSTIMYSFLLYHFNVSEIWWGIFITLYTIYWIIAIAIKVNEVSVDLNSETKKQSEKQSEFAKKLQEIIDKRKQ